MCIICKQLTNAYPVIHVHVQCGDLKCGCPYMYSHSSCSLLLLFLLDS